MNTVMCCGAERSSNFCPDCGSKLETFDPRTGLLSHIQKQVDAIRSRLGKQKTRVNDPRLDTERVKSKIEVTEKSLRKWIAWRDWVRSAIDVENHLMEMKESSANET